MKHAAWSGLLEADNLRRDRNGPMQCLCVLACNTETCTKAREIVTELGPGNHTEVQHESRPS